LTFFLSALDQKEKLSSHGSQMKGCNSIEALEMGDCTRGNKERRENSDCFNLLR